MYRERMVAGHVQTVDSAFVKANAAMDSLESMVYDQSVVCNYISRFYP